MPKSAEEEFPDFPALPPRYNLCANGNIKIAFGVGTLFQAAALCLIVTMLAGPPWMSLDTRNGFNASNKFTVPHSIGVLYDCFYDLNSQPTGYSPETSTMCYFRDFGQYRRTQVSQFQKHLSEALVVLIGLGILTSGCAIVMAIHLMVLWFKAPFDSLFMRNFRFIVGLTSGFSSLLVLAAIIVFHLGLHSEVMSMTVIARISTVMKPSTGYAIAWAAEAVNIVAAWILISSTCCWAVDYVNCSSIAAAFNVSCSQRQSMTQPITGFGIRNSAYSVNSLGKWSIQDVPTLPRFHTNTYGDGSELRKIQPVVQDSA